MLRKEEGGWSLLRLKVIASKFIAAVIVGLLLNMAPSVSYVFAAYDVKTETDGALKPAMWSAARKTIDLYPSSFERSFVKHTYSEKIRLSKNFQKIFIKKTTKYNPELLAKCESYIDYSESTTQVLDKSHIFFPFHYFW